MRSIAWCVLASWLCLLAVAQAHTPVLEGRHQPVDATDDAWTAFDPSVQTLIPRRPVAARVQLWVDETQAWPDQAVLVIVGPGMERFAWDEQGTRHEAWTLQVQRTGWFGHGRIAIPLERRPTAGQPFELHQLPQAGVNGRVGFRIQTQTEVLSQDARWVALVGICLAVLAGMAVIALVFMVRLRDATFGYYAAYLLGYAMIQILQTGYAGSPLGWEWVTATPRLWGRVAVVVTILMSVLFLVRFAALRTWLPGAVRPLHAYAALVLGSALLGLVPGLAQVASLLINPLIILGGPLLLVVAFWAWLRGSRYGGFFVVGWTPLLLITVAGSLHLYGWWPAWSGSNEAALVAAAFEAMVLSAGLADRAASVRSERDDALRLATLDPLTGAFNRRELEQRLAMLVARDAGHSPPGVLFIDLDHFKRLNDALGHHAGDEALRQVAAIIRARIRSADWFARVGGEEFVVVLPAASMEGARAIAERIRVDIEQLGQRAPFMPPGFSASLGVAQGRDGESAGALLDRADAAMYMAKGAGRNRVVLAQAGAV